MIIPLITHVRYRQRLRLLQSDTENAFMQQAFGNGAPVALTRSRIARWLAGIISANGFCQALSSSQSWLINWQ